MSEKSTTNFKMVERVAKVFYKNFVSSQIEWSNASDFMKQRCIEGARAAIEEMKEPTEGMMKAAFNNYMGYERQGPNKPAWNGRIMWQTMIDEALK